MIVGARDMFATHSLLVRDVLALVRDVLVQVRDMLVRVRDMLVRVREILAALHFILATCSIAAQWSALDSRFARKHAGSRQGSTIQW